MKKNYYLFLLVLFVNNHAFSQCGDYSEIVTQNLETVKFWDDQNGFAFGGAKLAFTNDGGNSWSDYQLADFATIYIEPLADCDILDDNSAIIVGHNGHILLTNDKGKSWSSKSVKYDGHEGLCTVDFVTSKIGYIAGFDFERTELIFYKTLDGGNNWEKIESNLTLNDLDFRSIQYYEFKIHYVNEKLGFLWKRNKLFKTIDGGITWNEISNPEIISGDPRLIFDINNSKSGKIILSTADNLYESDNDGSSWNVIPQTICVPNGPCLLTGMFDIRENTLVTQIGNFSNNRIISIDLLDKSSKIFNIENDIGYVTGINIYAENKIVFVGTGFNYSHFGRKIVRTINGGSTFETLDSFNAKKLNARTNTLTVFRNDDDILTASIGDDYKDYAWDSFGFFIHISKDDGNSWRQIVKEEKNTGKLLISKKQFISYVKYVDGLSPSEGFILKESNDYGQSWIEKKFNFPANTEPLLINLSALDENTFLFKTYLEYYYSIDKGETWNSINLPSVDGGTFYSYKFKSLNEIYAWGQKSNWPSVYDYFLYKSSDIGKTWTQVVFIPDNNGNDLGAVAATTYFGSNFAIVSTGGNTYFKVDLINNAYTSLPFKHPIKGSVYLSDDQMFMVNDNNWVISYSSPGELNYLATSYDQGANWQYKFCTMCGDNYVYNEAKNELITYSRDDLKIGKIKSYIPKEPIVFGNTVSKIGEIEEYFLPYDVFISETKWELSSGGEIIYFSDDQKGYYKIKVKWTTGGEHTLSAKRINDCGESNLASIKVNIPSLNVKDFENNNLFFVYPNPFNDKISIEANESSKIETIELYNVSGSKVLNYEVKNKSGKIILNNLENLSSGVYFLNIKQNDKKNQMMKIIKK